MDGMRNTMSEILQRGDVGVLATDTIYGIVGSALKIKTVERIYRQEGLTIAMLAAKLDMPQHRLRQAINEGLGHRNFNAFLNRYRIDEAKAALSDLSQRDVPVLTIAMDAGFQSIGPFNRAFKADTGLTPTEFRRDALAESQASVSKNDDAPGIGQPDRQIG